MDLAQTEFCRGLSTLSVAQQPVGRSGGPRDVTICKHQLASGPSEFSIAEKSGRLALLSEPPGAWHCKVLNINTTPSLEKDENRRKSIGIEKKPS